VSTLSGDNRIPRYIRLADSIKQQVIEGVLRPGNQVPSENELSLFYEVAPGTVRQALKELVNEGLLQRVQGKGTYVRRPDFDRSLFRFFKFLGGRDGTVIPDSKILSINVKSAPTHVCNSLRLKKNASAIFINRLRMLENRPVLVEQIWLSESRFKPLLALKKDEFGPLLYPIYEEKCNAIVARANEDLKIEVASIKSAEALGIERNQAVVVIDRLASGFDERPLEWRRSFGRADQFHYQIDIR